MFAQAGGSHLPYWCCWSGDGDGSLMLSQEISGKLIEPQYISLKKYFAHGVKAVESKEWMITFFRKFPQAVLLSFVKSESLAGL